MMLPTQRVAWFVTVGCAAAATHFAVVVALVNWLQAAPLWANIGGWLVAFGVSFSGHRGLTFRTANAPLRRSALRFFLVSAAGFAVNEAAYAALLQWAGWNYAVALAAVLLGVAVLTYWLSRHWAFLGSQGP